MNLAKATRGDHSALDALCCPRLAHGGEHDQDIVHAGSQVADDGVAGVEDECGAIEDPEEHVGATIEELAMSVGVESQLAATAPIRLAARKEIVHEHVTVPGFDTQ